MAETPPEEAQADALLVAGKQAFDEGDERKAHTLWQQAAHLTPRDEAIWWALLAVVDNDADRVACLENILKINPDNEEASVYLQAMKRMCGENDDKPAVRRPHFLESIMRTVVTLAVLVGLFILGMIIGVILNLL